jgi:DnaJ-class molecular chaperone
MKELKTIEDENMDEDPRVMFDDDDCADEPRCHSCGGDGWVDNVAQESGRMFWDTYGPGPCPNCGGSGLRKDCTTF